MPVYVRKRQWWVDQNHTGWRLDAFLANRIPRLSRTQAKRIVDAGGVSLSPIRRAKAASVLRCGDCVTLRQSFDEPEVDDDTVGVIHEAPGMVVVNKPAGMLVHPTARVFANTLVEWGKRTGRGDLYVVHRLDRDTSGVMIMATDADVASALVSHFEAFRVEKRYTAVVVDPDGRYEPGAEGVFDAPLGLQPHSPLPSLLMGRGDLPAETFWRCESRCEDLACVDVRIRGGRQHQIRVHFALAGTPLVGDKLYGHGPEFYLAWCDGHADGSVLRASRQALHARVLALDTGGGRQRFVAPLPTFFTELMSASP